MKKMLIFILVSLFLALSACSTDSGESAVAGELGVDVSSAAAVSFTDTHGGFHGDGKTFAVFSFADDTLLEQLQENPAWSQFPLDSTLSVLVYGTAEDTGSTAVQNGPYLTTDDATGAPLIPEIQNGYYRLLDRHSDQEETDILRRSSFNFTLGIYDADTKTLYCCKLDT